MTVYYFASRYSRHEEMRQYRFILERDVPGAKVTSRWIDLHDGEVKESFLPRHLNFSPDACWPYGAHDLDDIDQADVVVSFTSEGGKGGRHVEFGYALAKAKRLVLVGSREHIFHTHPAVEQYGSFADFCKEEVRRSDLFAVPYS